MENSLINSDALLIPKKPRSLDLQSLYVENSTRDDCCGDGFKRKRQSSEPGGVDSGSGQDGKKQNTLIEPCLSSPHPGNKTSTSSSNVVDDDKLSQIVFERNNSANYINDQASGVGNLLNLGGVTGLSCSFDENVISIPKRPRCFSRTRRKNFESSHMAMENGNSSKVGSDANSSKVSIDALMIKSIDHSVASIPSFDHEQKVINNVQKNNLSRAIPAARSKTRNGASVRHRDLNSKSVQTSHGRKQQLKEQENALGHTVENSVHNPAKPHEDLDDDDDDDDEENLEENAARMLSARFDPSCTVFSGNGSSSASQSTNVFSFGSSIPGDFVSPLENRPSGLESTSDPAGRILRPRKESRLKRLTRKRRHFYEILSRDVDAYWVVNRRIKVFWPLDQSWYFGLVSGYDPEQMLHHIKYDDRDEEWIDLQNERFKLLLLPSEVPHKTDSKNPVLGCNKKMADKTGEMGGNEKLAAKTGEMDVEDGDCGGNYMDSEPIISWLALSNHRVKSSPLGMMKKQQTNYVSTEGGQPSLSEDSVGTIHGCSADVPVGIDTCQLSTGLDLPDRSADKETDEKEVAQKSMKKRVFCSKGTEPRYVYFRKRFRLSGQQSLSSECRSISISSIHPSITNRAVEDLALGCVLWSGDNIGLLKLTVHAAASKQVTLNLRVPLHWACLAYGSQYFSMYRAILLLRCGTLSAAWPKVQLQMLFVDNVVGLRFMVFEGCLMQAVAFVCLILIVFKQHSESQDLVDPQLPVTSIRLDLSDFQHHGRRLVFTFYNFLELKNSKWLYLDGKLKHHCSVTKQLPLSECTYDNIKVFQSRSSQLPIPTIREDPVAREVPLRRSRKSGRHMGIYKESTKANMALSVANFNEKPNKLPPVVLPFSAAPTFFLNLHLKLLMAKSVASVRFSNPMSLLERAENCGELTVNDCSVSGETSDAVTVDNDTEISLNRNGTGSALVSCAESKAEIDAFPISNDNGWTKSPEKCLNSELIVAETSVGPRDSGRNENDDYMDLQKYPSHHSGSAAQGIARPQPSIPGGYSSRGKPLEHFSFQNNLKVHIPAVNEDDNHVGPLSAPQSTSDLVWSVKDCAIRSPNPTAPRSIWHHNRQNSGSLSFSHRSRMWPDGREDLSHNLNGLKKPRSQVSHLLPFGSSDFSSRPRSHHRNRRPYKKTRTDTEKAVPSGSGSPEGHPELLSCDTNLLITEGDRGWRESGAQVVLDCVDHNDWRLLVKFSGVIKYSHKAYQFLQPGTTNRYTHAMIWKGGKNWSLEFPDRSQWILFKEMHEECYNRNIRAASAKTIPIPGVRMIEENEDNPIEVPFFRSSPMYFQQVETEVEMALNPSCVLYDMESDDEEWISKRGISSEACSSNSMEVSEEMFERTMDLFEKVSYAHQRDNFTSDEIEELMVGVGPIHLVKEIYEYWQQKRQKKGLPLIRQFQPPLWERYQQQLKEWEAVLNRIPNGCKEKAILIQKPPMYAFCLRPRGLEVPNKGSKQRSHRKLSSSGHNYSFSRDIDGQHGFGRRFNGAYGDDRFGSGPNHDPLYASSWHTSTRVMSPRDAVSTGGDMSMSSDGSERIQYRKLQRNKSKKIKTIISSNETQPMSPSYNHNQRATSKRNGSSSSSRWNAGVPEVWPSQKQYQHRPDGFQRPSVEFDEFRLRDASSAAQHASNMAKLKREKAQRLLYRADLAIHKAMVALMTAEAIKASSEDSFDDS